LLNNKKKSKKRNIETGFNSLFERLIRESSPPSESWNPEMLK
jgi:hypothetical protein